MDAENLTGKKQQILNIYMISFFFFVTVKFCVNSKRKVESEAEECLECFGQNSVWLIWKMWKFD